MMQSLRTLVLLAIAVVLSATIALSQPAEDVGPRAFARIGVENPHGVQPKESGDFFLRGGVGFEWFGLFGSKDACFVGEWMSVGFLQNDVDSETRYHWGARYYLSGYWPGASPWVEVGVEHQGGDFIVNQENLTRVAVGVEPKIKPLGWVQVLWESVGWGMERPTEMRFAIDFVPGRTGE